MIKLNLFIKQCYCITWSVEKIQKVKSKSCKEKKQKNNAFIKKCAVCNSKKSKFIKQQEAIGLLSSLGIKTPLSKIPLVGLYLF